MTNKLIAIVDDEPDIVELVSLYLNKAGFQVKGFQDAESLFMCLEKETPDLIILDLMLPDTDGIEVCKVLKKDRFATIPVIMLTARGEESDRVLGLELGADDYVAKPFSPKELVARVKAVLRRNAQIKDDKMIRITEDLIIDLERYEVFVDGEKVELTTTEFNILNILSSRKGLVFTRDNILYQLWGDEKAVLDRSVDVHIKHLREKLGRLGMLIKSIRGVGYKLEDI